jgi:hypothetical protein
MIRIINMPKVLLLFVTILPFSLSLKFKEPRTADGLFMFMRHTHKGYYDTGELRYICYDKNTGQIGRGTGTVRKFKFKRVYYDKCGNTKLIVTGKGESGCWRNKLTITDEKVIKEPSTSCEKGEFAYPSRTDLELEIMKGKLKIF